MNTQKTGKVMLLCLLALLSVGQTTAPERSLDGLPLQAEVGQLKLYSADGNQYILAHGNAIVATRIKIDGQDEFSAFDRGFLAHQQNYDARGKSLKSFKHVVRSGENVGVYIDLDGDGIFEQYYDIEKRKRYDIELTERPSKR